MSGAPLVVFPETLPAEKTATRPPPPRVWGKDPCPPAPVVVVRPPWWRKRGGTFVGVSGDGSRRRPTVTFDSVDDEGGFDRGSVPSRASP